MPPLRRSKRRSRGGRDGFDSSSATRTAMRTYGAFGRRHRRQHGSARRRAALHVGRRLSTRPGRHGAGRPATRARLGAVRGRAAHSKQPRQRLGPVRAGRRLGQCRNVDSFAGGRPGGQGPSRTAARRSGWTTGRARHGGWVAGPAATDTWMAGRDPTLVAQGKRHELVKYMRAKALVQEPVVRRAHGQFRGQACPHRRAAGTPARLSDEQGKGTPVYSRWTTSRTRSLAAATSSTTAWSSFACWDSSTGSSLGEVNGEPSFGWALSRRSIGATSDAERACSSRPVLRPEVMNQRTTNLDSCCGSASWCWLDPIYAVAQRDR